MLTIRRDQLEVFQAELDERFARVVDAHMREEWPEECQALGDEALHDRSLRCIREARELGLRQDRSILRLSSLRFRYGESFPDPVADPEFHFTLRDCSRTEPHRFEAVDVLIDILRS